MTNIFENVREWGTIRGLAESTFHQQYQRVLQEIVEIHEAHTNGDLAELSDAIGDSMITLINLARTMGLYAETCLSEAFGVIEHRKGLTKNGSFVRYAKLSPEDRHICDEKQGSPNSEYFDPAMTLTPDNFMKD